MFLNQKQNLEKQLSLQYILKPFLVVSEAFFILPLFLHKVSLETFTLLNLPVETSVVGTQAIPVNFPFNSGITFPTALAAPVEDGIMLHEAARPPLQF
jgi:hypothetical protein